MAITGEQIAALEQFFLTAQIPQKLELNKAITMYNVPTQINEKINMLRADVLSEKVAAAFYDQLIAVKRAIEK